MSRMMALISSGIPYAVGSDGMHGELSEEIRYLVEMGASNIDALQAATINGAKVAGIEKQTGSLEAGKKADIIAISGNPLKNIKALKKVKAVMQEGEWIVKPVEPEI
jgi:imidazolonepropionase-like amidohydrolase